MGKHLNFWGWIQVVTLSFFTVCAALSFFNPLYVLIALIALPFSVVAFVSFIMNIRMKNMKSRILIGWNLLNLFLLLAAVFMPRGCFAYDMQEHYESHIAEFHNITSYVSKICNPDMYLTYNIESGEHLTLNFPNDFFTTEGESAVPMDTILRQTSFSRHDFDSLRAMLEKVDCYGISYDDEYIELDYSRYVMGVYSYIIYNRPLTALDSAEIERDVRKIMYRDGIVFSYDPGVIGSFHFPERERYIQNDNE